MLNLQSILDLKAVRDGKINFTSDGGRGNTCKIFGRNAVYCLNLDRIHPGSIILTYRSGAAAVLQGTFFSAPECKMWSHIGLVGVDRYVYDVMPDQHVRRVSMEFFLREAQFVAARAYTKKLLDHSRLAEVMGQQASNKYIDVLDAQQLLSFMARQIGSRISNFQIEPSHYICSTYVERVLTMAGNTMCLDKKMLLHLPGHFAQSNNFTDIHLASQVNLMSA